MFRWCAAWSVSQETGVKTRPAVGRLDLLRYKRDPSIRSDTGRTGLVRQNTATSGRFITDLRNHPYPFVGRWNLARSPPRIHWDASQNFRFQRLHHRYAKIRSLRPSVPVLYSFCFLQRKNPTICTLAGFIPGRSVCSRVGSRGGKRAQAHMTDWIIRLISKRFSSERYSKGITSAAIDDYTTIQADREEYNHGCLCGDLQWI